MPDQEEQGLDRVAAPDLDQVTTVRDEQAVELEQWLASVTAEELLAVGGGACRTGLAAVRSGEDRACVPAGGP